VTRHAFTVGLWVASIVLLGLLLVRGGPWLWPRLFPAPPDPVSTESTTVPDAAELAERLSRFGAGWGAPGDAALLELPKGRTPRELQDDLRADPRFAGLEIYVTRADDLAWTLRLFGGGQELLQRPVRPWLPDRPTVPDPPPKLGFVVVVEQPDEDAARRLGRWDVPLAAALPPFDAQTMKAARQLAWEQKDVVLHAESDAPMEEQLAAVPQASGVLLLGDPPAGAWLAAIAGADAFLLDGRDGPDAELRAAAAAAGVRWMRPAGALKDPHGAKLSRNRTVRGGRGVLLASGDEAGLAALEEFVTTAREDGYELVFPAEAARASANGDP